MHIVTCSQRVFTIFVEYYRFERFVSQEVLAPFDRSLFGTFEGVVYI